MKLYWTVEGVGDLERVLMRLSATSYRDVVSKNLTQMYNRSADTGAPGGGTPVDTGELRNSRGMQMDMLGGGQFGGAFGYRASYAPHVEFGHRTKGGGYVPGQRYLHQNVKKQQPIFKKDVELAIARALKGVRQ